MLNLSRIAPALCLLLVSAVSASATFVANPAALSANTAVTWSQLGTVGSTIPSNFKAAGANGLAVNGALSGGSGTLAEACPAMNCNYANVPGIGGGDFLVWTEDLTGKGNGPLSLNFSNPVQGAGLYLELTDPGSYMAIFTISTSTGTVSELLTSDPNGDPVFLGALDATADIRGLSLQVGACAASTPGGCNASDFAIDTLLLVATVPEPGTWALILPPLAVLAFYGLLFRRSDRKNKALAAATVALVSVSIAQTAGAQTPVPYQPGDAQTENGTALAAQLPQADSRVALPQTTVPVSGANLPIWSYRLVSRLDGLSYSGYMIGQNPFSRGARTTTIPTILIPVIVNFQNTTSGFTATFDPSGTPDAGCTAGQTALDLVANSPLFATSDWTLNGTHVGAGQYIDAFQRANFWQYVQQTGDAYHTVLSYTLGDPLTVAVTYTAPTLSAEVRTGVAGPCTNPNGAGSVNGSGYEGYVNMSTIDAAARSYIFTHGISADQFPIFILYNVVMPNLNNPGFYTGGYHASTAGYLQRLTTPGQTYAVADFQTNFFFSKPNLDVSLLSHEIAEWMADPGDANPTPLWGNIGQVAGCQNNLEVGDPLTGTNLPLVSGPGGFNYHLQELAFFSWFFRTPPTGAGGAFSNNGSFASDAGAACTP